MSSAKPKVVPMDQTTSEVQPQSTPGAAQMRVAADLVLAQHCMEIAEALSNNSKKGDTRSAKFLYQLSEKAESSARAEGASKFRSMAMVLANSPQWQGEPEKRQNDVDESAYAFGGTTEDVSRNRWAQFDATNMERRPSSET